jgi:hypothetical protein
VCGREAEVCSPGKELGKMYPPLKCGLFRELKEYCGRNMTTKKEKV